MTEEEQKNISQLYKPEERNDINNSIIKKLDEIIELNNEEKVTLHHKTDQNQICEELKQLCQLDINKKLEPEKEKRRYFLIQELFKTGKQYHEESKEFEDKMNQVISLIEEIKTLQTKSSDINNLSKFKEEVKKIIKSYDTDNYDNYLTRLNILKTALKELINLLDGIMIDLSNDNNKPKVQNVIPGLKNAIERLNGDGEIKKSDIDPVVLTYFNSLNFNT